MTKLTMPKKRKLTTIDVLMKLLETMDVIKQTLADIRSALQPAITLPTMQPMYPPYVPVQPPLPTVVMYGGPSEWDRPYVSTSDLTYTTNEIKMDDALSTTTSITLTNDVKTGKK
jgi:hypothetical protein